MLFLFCIALVGCKSSKRIVENKSFDNAQQMLHTFEQNQLEYNTLELKARCKFKEDNKNINFSAIIRIQPNEKIWVSGRVLGFEGVRALITPDSIFIINRLKRSYIAESSSALDQYISIPAEFSSLEQLLVGGILLPIHSFSVQEKESNILLSRTTPDYTHSLEFFPDGFLKSQSIRLLSKAFSSTIEYNDLKQLEQGQIPAHLNLSAQGEKPMSAEIKYTDISVNKDLSFAFQIPDSYEKQ